MLTAKNLQCMRSILSIAHCHGDLLGPAWHIFLTTLQHLVWILGLRARQLDCVMQVLHSSAEWILLYWNSKSVPFNNSIFSEENSDDSTVTSEVTLVASEVTSRRAITRQGKRRRSRILLRSSMTKREDGTTEDQWLE